MKREIIISEAPLPGAFQVKNKITVPVSGLHCASCSDRVKKGLMEINGVKSVDINISESFAAILLEEGVNPSKSIIDKIRNLGYDTGIERKIVTVKGIHCAGCVGRIEKNLKNLPGIIEAVVNLTESSANIEFITGTVSKTEIAEVVKSSGSFEIVPEANEKSAPDYIKIEQNREYSEYRSKFILSAVVTLIIMTGMIKNKIPGLYNIPDQGWNYFIFILTSFVLFYCGKSFFDGLINGIRKKYADMDTLVSIGTFSAWLYGSMVTFFPELIAGSGERTGLYFDSAAMIITLILFGRLLESRAKKSTSGAIAELLKLKPQFALIKRNGKEIEVPVEEVSKGDKVLVKPGDKIPVDGKITSGSTFINEAMITGESLPVEKNINSEVIGGTINTSGSFWLVATRTGKETFLSQIIELVRKAQLSKAPIQRIADKVAGIFVPIVLVIATATFTAWILFSPEKGFVFALMNFISVLIIACPCSLGLATPTAIIVGMGKGARRGILIKNGESLENACKINTMILDKTGTITYGLPEVIDVINPGKIPEREFLSIIASIEKRSEHPLGKAVIKYAEMNSISFRDISSFEYTPGKGIKAEIDGNVYYTGSIDFIKEKVKDPGGYEIVIDEIVNLGRSPVLLADENILIGILSIADTIKPSSISAVVKFKEMGINVIMMSGDNRKVAGTIAEKAGIDNVFAEVLPEKKVEKVKEQQQNGKVVGMIGDGINDAPALAAADTGLAIGTGTGIAMESADITLVRGDLEDAVSAIKLSKKTLRIIKQNLFWAFFYNIIGISAASGILYPFTGLLLNPVIAAGAMAFSSVSVVTNSLRLKNVKI